MQKRETGFRALVALSFLTHNMRGSRDWSRVIGSLEHSHGLAILTSYETGVRVNARKVHVAVAFQAREKTSAHFTPKQQFFV